jgi:hypothetical protein
LVEEILRIDGQRFSCEQPPLPGAFLSLPFDNVHTLAASSSQP